MSTNSQTAEFFHDYATGFDAIYGNTHKGLTAWVNQHLRKSMRERFEMTLAGCDPIEGKSVLDIGCGPGHFAIILAERGAGPVVGLDFAEGMLDTARKNAADRNVADKCAWMSGDFHEVDPGRRFDYSIVCGFMDYMDDPVTTVRRVLSFTRGKAFFSFPSSAGLLALQRRIRYKWKCPLYLYSRNRVDQVMKKACEDSGFTYRIDPCARDFFVTATAP